MKLARCVALAVVVVAAWSTRGLAQGVRVLRAHGQLNFREIAEALQVAKDGDVILVGEGDYAPFEITDKSVTVMAAPNAQARITGLVEIRSLPFNKEVVLSGLIIEHPGGGLEVGDSPGPVRVQDCTIGPGWPEVVLVWNSRNVAFVDCSVRGSDGPDGYPYGGGGGTALVALQSTIAVYGSSFQGGHGGDGGKSGGDAGHGGALSSTTLYSVGGAFRGGDGGDAPESDELGGTWGNGGHGLLLTDGSHAQLRSTKLHGGDDGCDAYSGHCCGVPPGSCPVPPIQLYGSTAAYDSGLPRELWTRPWSPDATYMSVSFDAQPMDVGFLFSGRAVLQHEPSVLSTWLVHAPSQTAAIPIIVLGPTGQGNVQLRTSPWGRLYRRMWLQGFVRSSTGEALLTNPRHVVVLSKYRGPDCNNNNVQDYIEVLAYPGTDLNDNLIPDDCEP